MHAPFALGAAELLRRRRHRHQPLPGRRRDPGRAAQARRRRDVRGQGRRRRRQRLRRRHRRPARAARAGRPPAARRSSAASSSCTTSRSCGSPTGASIGVESLVRWRDPSRGGLVPPGEFIPVAERTGVIDALGDWVLHEVCAQARDVGRGRPVPERRLQRLAAPAAPPGRRAALRRGGQRARHRARPLRARDHRVGVVAGGLAAAAGARRAARRRLRAGDRRLRRRLLLAVAPARAARPDHQGRPRVPGRRSRGPAGAPPSTRRSCGWPTRAAATSSPRASRRPSTPSSWSPTAAGSPRASTSAARCRAGVTRCSRRRSPRAAALANVNCGWVGRRGVGRVAIPRVSSWRL